MTATSKARLARKASRTLALTSGRLRSHAITEMAESLMRGADLVLAQNELDVKDACARGTNEAMINRLRLSLDKIRGMADALKEIAAMPDVLGETIESFERPNGLTIQKVRVPLGVVGIIYESRPNVTSDAAGLCVKSGNAVVLRGGSEALRSNAAIADLLRVGLESGGLDPDCVQIIETADRAEVSAMLGLHGLIDVIVPRGGPGLIRQVVSESKVPVIETGAGNCHVYVDRAADLPSALKIAVNAKCSYPSVCNAAETLLIHEAVADAFLPEVAKELEACGVELRGCERSRAIVARILPAVEEDWDEEYLRLVLAIKVVDDADEAIAHINAHGTGHSEAIVSEDSELVERFLAEVDAACVYANASTRFTDGGEFGFGAEIGISTQRLHARGPMGIRELTSHKFVVRGDGHIR